jgi:hypothetical protein
MTETLTYIVRNISTGKTIECHEEDSKERAYDLVSIHNSVYKGISREQWEVVVEML